MRYNETYLGTARDAYDLVVLLTDEEVPRTASIEIDTEEAHSNCEVWYDKETNTIIIK
jgi:hypothetical protein